MTHTGTLIEDLESLVDRCINRQPSKFPWAEDEEIEALKNEREAESMRGY